MAENEQEISKTLTLLKLYQQFGDSTSMHGIGRVLTNKSTWKRGVWSVMFLLGLAFVVYQFVITINDYYSYPVTTEVILQNEIMASFPGVTICNLNIKRKSMIDEDLLQIIESYEKTINDMINDIPDYIHHLLLHNNTKAEDKESGHQISDILINCWFNTYQCTEVDFIQVNTASYGACYTFNIANNLLQAGSQNGLILELNIEQDEYLPITSKAGAKIIVHPTDEYPFPEDGGILAHPGAVTSIELKKVITHRLPEPYSACVDASEQGSTQLNMFPNKKYSQKACLKSCYQLALYNECECCDPDVPCDYFKILNVDKNTTTNASVPHLEACTSSLGYVWCQGTIEDDFMSGELGCDKLCPSSCDRTTFDTVVSSALWSSRTSFNVFVDFLNNTVLHNRSFEDKTSLELYLRSNFLRLEIFFDRLEFLEFSTYAKYDWTLLLGTIGGLLGLCLGFSLLTAVEIVEVLIDTALCFTRRKHKQKTTVQPEQI